MKRLIEASPLQTIPPNHYFCSQTAIKMQDDLDRKVLSIER